MLDERPVDGDPKAIVFAAAVIASLWLVAFAGFNVEHVWESHKTGGRQWLVTAVVFLAFAAEALLPARMRDRAGDAALRAVAAVRTLVTTRLIGAAFVAILAGVAAEFSFAVLTHPETRAGRTLLWIVVLVTIACLAALGRDARAFASNVRAVVARARRTGRILTRAAVAHKTATVGFAAAASIVASIVAPAPYGAWALQCVAAFVAVAYLVRVKLGLSNRPSALLRFGLACASLAVVALTTYWLVVHGRRFTAATLGIAQGFVWLRLRQDAPLDRRTVAGVVAASVLAWSFCAGFTFVPFADWLLAASSVTALSAFALLGAFALVSLELVPHRPFVRPKSGVLAVLPWALAAGAFIVLSLRTDGLLSDWVPYHRSYWVGPADFVRAGGWLLWDVPSQYGFLSALSLAVWPASSTWQALYEQLAIVLTLDGIVLFALLRHGRSGRLNAAFAFLLTAAALYSSEGARVPFGWRLYPQAGLRFMGFIALAGIAFAIYVARENDRTTRGLYVLGYAVWFASLLWSFECGLISSFIWIPYVAFELVRDLRTRRASLHESAQRAAAAFLPFLCLPALAAATLEAWYRYKLGHPPDFTGFTEFAFSYNAEQVTFRAISATGTGWTLIALLIALGAVALRALRLRVASAPLLCAAWVAAWGVSSYYVSEGFNNHVNALAPVFVELIAIALAADRLEAREHRPFALVKLSERALFAPLLVMLVAQAFSNPAELAGIRTPLLGGSSFDTTSTFDTNSAEIRTLAKRAGIAPSDRVIYPASNWHTKLDTGLTLPFSRDDLGRVDQHIAWLPLSPVGPFDVLMTLPYDRRTTYLQRYYEHVRDTGWLYAYHQPVDCRRYVPGLQTTRIYRSENYELALCVNPEHEARAASATSAAKRSGV